jgi:hypothetical protein
MVERYEGKLKLGKIRQGKLKHAPPSAPPWRLCPS